MTFTIHEQKDGERRHFMSGVDGRDLHEAARRIRQSGAEPVAYCEQDNQRVWV